MVLAWAFDIHHTTPQKQTNYNNNENLHSKMQVCKSIKQNMTKQHLLQSSTTSSNWNDQTT